MLMIPIHMPAERVDAQYHASLLRVDGAISRERAQTLVTFPCVAGGFYDIWLVGGLNLNDGRVAFRVFLIHGRLEALHFR